MNLAPLSPRRPRKGHGATPRAAAVQARPALAISHAPWRVFISDLRDDPLGLNGVTENTTRSG
ncbi:hypothetical protein [Metapseudomonas furukawaii]|jgi:hypothetical protein|uniref:Uncharacterized protein n=1 Tax=Metapseudomonas furukawaii TaxID=1149133 RepID=L8MIK6_METFU|nr:hypothetical protein [Pseudomonas furukawaii]ELS26255.1 hypothetical protein ppKF707_5893 [Pseudomonas furukawaii]ELS28333.1 hypothetical protein ppKF707_6033 [Pseudomonas furukawaii]BAU76298.1 hypothetical protein KF707C_46100 [Pseudomonas furukawaii]